MRLMLFVRKGLRPFVSDARKTSKATGIGGVIGNKGAVVLKARERGWVVRACVCACVRVRACVRENGLLLKYIVCAFTVCFCALRVPPAHGCRD